MGRPTRLFAALVCTTLLAACGAGSEDTGGNTAAGGEEKAGGSGDPILIGIGVAQTSLVALLGQEEVVGAKIAEQFFKLGYTGLIIGGNGLNTTNVFPVCAKACDGVLIAQA